MPTSHTLPSERTPSNHNHTRVVPVWSLTRYLLVLHRASYVFENYTWDKTASGDFSSFNGKPIPARVPLTALLSGASISPCILCHPYS